MIICQGKLSDKDQETKLLADKAGELTLETIADSIKIFKQIIPPEWPNRRFNNNGFKQNAYIPSALKNFPAAEPLKMVLNEGFDSDKMEQLKKIFLENAGESKVYLKIGQGSGGKILETGFRIKHDDSLKEKIKNKFGEYIKIIDKK